MEARLELKLLLRSTSKTKPTELGQQYYNGLKKIIDDKNSLEQELRSSVKQISGVFKVSTTVDVAENFVVPVIRDMQNNHPELKVELILGSGVDNLIEKEIDVALRFAPLIDSSLIAKKLAVIPTVMVASKQYLAKYGCPNDIADLRNHSFVLYYKAMLAKGINFRDGDTLHFNTPPNCPFIANSLKCAKLAVLDSAGIHIGPRWLYEKELVNEAVIEILPDKPPEELSVYGVYVSRSYMPKKTSMFLELIKDAFSEVSL